MRTDTVTLASALDVLAREIESGDGVANAAIAEAAGRLRELAALLEGYIRSRDILGEMLAEAEERMDRVRAIVDDAVANGLTQIQTRLLVEALEVDLA